MPFSPDLLYGWEQKNSVEAQKEMFGKPSKFMFHCVFTTKNNSLLDIVAGNGREA